MRRASAMGIFSVIMLILAGAAFVLMVLRPAMLGTGAASGGGGTPAAPDVPVFTAPDSRIAFVSELDGNTEIYTMKPDGSDVFRLTHNDGYDLSPQWSPDGSRIAWVSEMGGQRDVYVMNADGSGVIRLTNTPDNEFDLKWSPTGMEIAYNTSPFTNDISLMKISASGGDPQMLSMKLPNEASWSPDGTEITFATHAAAPNEVVVLNAASGEVVRSFENDRIGFVAWHPQESLIAFAPRPYSSLRAGLWLIDSTHLSEATVVVDNMDVTAITWSRYGSYLAYYDSTDDMALASPDLYVLDMINRTEPLHIARVIEPRGFDWSPDEAQIVYASKHEDGQYKIFVVRRDQAFVEGMEHEILTHGMEPDWSPYLGPFPQPTPTDTPTLDPLATGYSETATAQAQQFETPTPIPTVEPLPETLTPTPTPLPTNPPAAIIRPPTTNLLGDVSREIVNYGEAFCALYMVPSDTHYMEWGVNWLAEGQVIASNQTLLIESVAQGPYDLKTEGCTPERNITSFKFRVGVYSWLQSTYIIDIPTAVLAVDNLWTDICGLYIAPPHPMGGFPDDWGRNLLTVGDSIPPGTIWRVPLIPGDWSMKAEDCADGYFAETIRTIDIGEFVWTLTPE